MRLIRHDAERGTRLVDDDRSHEGLLSIEQLDEVDEGAEELGVKVDGSTAAEALVPHLGRLTLVAIVLPKFTDGRAYSLARLLRERHGYRGELRAVGNVLREQLFYLYRCGFDSFVLAEGKDPQDALSAFSDFSVTYQPAVDHQQPIWRRRG